MGNSFSNKSSISNVIQQLHDEISELISSGVDTFICGGYVGFDLLAASFIVTKKEQDKKIKLLFVLPFRGYEDCWKGEHRKFLLDLIGEADKVTYACNSNNLSVFRKQCTIMIRKSSFCIICDYTNEYKELLEHQMMKNIKIISIT